MKQPHQPSDAPSSQAPGEQRLDAFWRKALAAAPEASIDTTKLTAARAAIFAAAQQHSTASERRTFNPWHAVTAWWSTGAQGFAPPRWATGFASITLASLVLVLWYERLPEPGWDFDSASVMPAAAPVFAPAPAPMSAAPMAEPAPETAMAAPLAANAEESPRAAARKAPEARLQAAPNASMAEAAPATAPERGQTQPTPPMPAPLADAAQPHNMPSSSVTLYGVADVAISSEKRPNHALQAQVQASDGIAWRANAQSLFAPLDASQTKNLLALLEPLAQQATAATQANSQPKRLASLQRESLQLLFKQSGQVSLIAHIVSSPHYQIDWVNTDNAWLASTPMDEAAYNRITTTITKP